MIALAHSYHTRFKNKETIKLLLLPRLSFLVYFIHIWNLTSIKRRYIIVPITGKIEVFLDKLFNFNLIYRVRDIMKNYSSWIISQ
jgi:hypothetical protein